MSALVRISKVSNVVSKRVRTSVGTGALCTFALVLVPVCALAYPGMECNPHRIRARGCESAPLRQTRKRSTSGGSKVAIFLGGPASPQLVAVLVGTLHPEERLNVDHVPWPEIAQVAL